MKKQIALVLVIPITILLVILIIYSCNNDNENFRLDHVMDNSLNKDIEQLNNKNDNDETNNNKQNDEENNQQTNELDKNNDSNNKNNIGYINAPSGLRMRNTPSLEGDLVAKIPFNEEVEIISEDNNEIVIGGKTGKWVRVVWRNKSGWVFDAYLNSKKTEVEEAIGTMYITADSGLRMRDGAGVDSKVIHTIPFNEEVEILDEKPNIEKIGGVAGKWVKIRWNRKTGWVFSAYLGEYTPQTESWKFKKENKGNVYSMIVLDDGSSIAVGSSEDYYVVKLTNEGKTEWEKTYGGMKEEMPGTIIQDNNGGYIIAGTSDSDDIIPSVGENTKYTDFYVIKIDKDGNLLWEAMYPGAFLESYVSVVRSRSGGYLISGTCASDKIRPDKGKNSGERDIYFMKIDEDGNKEWDAMYGGDDWDQPDSRVLQTHDGGYIVTGYTLSKDIEPMIGKNRVFISDSLGSTGDLYVIKINSEGDKVWDLMYGGTGKDWGESITDTPDGGYIIGGWTNSSDLNPDKGKNNTVGGNYSFNYDVIALKISSEGFPEWCGMYGGDRDDYASHIETSPDGGYVICGNTDSKNINFTHGKRTALKDMYVIKLDYEGNREWEGTYNLNNDMKNDVNNAYIIKSTFDNGYIIGGVCDDKDLCMMKITDRGVF